MRIPRLNHTLASAPGTPAALARTILPRDESSLWWEAAAVHTAHLAETSGEADPALIPVRKAAAEALLVAEESAAAAALGRRQGTDAQWLRQVRRAGTTADRVAAASVMVQDGALTQLAALDTLLGMAAKRGGARAVVGATLDALAELFATVLLPDRRLRFFEQQPLAALTPGVRGDDLALLYLHFEDCMKKRYARFVDALEEGSKDNLDFVKDKSVRAMYDLLRYASGEEGGESVMRAEGKGAGPLLPAAGWGKGGVAEARGRDGPWGAGAAVDGGGVGLRHR